MGGYGLYVWGSYLLALVMMCSEVLLLYRRKNTLRNQGRSSRNDPKGGA
jgi:heme exporter protein D